MRLSFLLLFISLFFSCSTIDINKQTAIGLRQYKNDSLAESTATLSMVITVNDTCRQCLLYRGFAYKGIGQYDKAFADFTKLIGIDSTESIAYANRASIYYIK